MTHQILCPSIIVLLLFETIIHQVLARDIADFVLENKQFNPIVYHGFSVGGYLWGEVLKHCINDHPRYLPFTSRVRGQILDSGVDVTEIPAAFPKAVFPKNKTIQSLMTKFISCQMEILYEQSTRHYKASRQAFGEGIIRGPTLFIYSDSDPMSTKEINNAAASDLRNKNLPCTIKEFSGAKHVMNYQKHKGEYLAVVSNFLDSLNLDVIVPSDSELYDNETAVKSKL